MVRLVRLLLAAAALLLVCAPARAQNANAASYRLVPSASVPPGCIGFSCIWANSGNANRPTLHVGGVDVDLLACSQCTGNANTIQGNAVSAATPTTNYALVQIGGLWTPRPVVLSISNGTAFSCTASTGATTCGVSIGTSSGTVPAGNDARFPPAPSTLGNGIIDNGAGAYISQAQQTYDARNYSSFAAAVTAIGSTPATLTVSTTMSVPASVSIPSTLTLNLIGAGLLNVASGQTVTINGPLNAPMQQIFTGAGVVSFGHNCTNNNVKGNGYVPWVTPVWWGAVSVPISDVISDFTTAFQAALNTCSTVYVPPGNWNIASGISMPGQGQTMFGASYTDSEIRYLAASGNALTMGTAAGTANQALQSIYITNSNSTPTRTGQGIVVGGNGAALRFVFVDQFYIGIANGTGGIFGEEVWSENNRFAALQMIGTQFAHISNLWLAAGGSNNGNYGLVMKQASNNYIANAHISSATINGIWITNNGTGNISAQNTLEQVYVKQSGQAGVLVDGGSIGNTFANCFIHDNNTTSQAGHLGAGYDLEQASNTHITGGNALDDSGTPKQTYGVYTAATIEKGAIIDGVTLSPNGTAALSLNGVNDRAYGNAQNNDNAQAATDDISDIYGTWHFQKGITVPAGSFNIASLTTSNYTYAATFPIQVNGGTSQAVTLGGTVGPFSCAACAQLSPGTQQTGNINISSTLEADGGLVSVGGVTAPSLNPAANAGTNVSGTDLIVAGGRGTGNSAASNIYLRTTRSGGSGAGAQPLVDVLRLTYSTALGGNPLLVLGGGDGTASLFPPTLRGPSATGADLAGAGVTHGVGLGTGAGTSGNWKVQYSVPTTSGTTQQVAADALSVNGSTGLVSALQGLTVVGPLTLPSTSVTNAMLLNSIININAPAGMTGWGPVSLGGTLSPSWSSGAANLFWATPSGASGAPSLRALAVADLPTNIPNANLANSQFVLTLPSRFSGGGALSLGGTWTITENAQNANQVLAGPTSGVPGTPSFRSLVAADIPAIAESGVTGLTTDLAAKATDSLVLHLAGVETITGTKTFSTLPTLPSASANQVLATPNGSSGSPTMRALVAADVPALAESGVTNLVTDLAAKAPLASPVFTGTPTFPAGTGTATGNVPVMINEQSSSATSGATCSTIAGGETTAFTFTVPANTLSGNGQTLHIVAQTKHGSGTTNTAAAKLYWDTFVITLKNVTGQASQTSFADARVARLDSSTGQTGGYFLDGGGIAINPTSPNGTQTSQNWATTHTIKLTVTGATADNDLCGTLMKVFWEP